MLTYYTAKEIESRIDERFGEQKLGQTITLISNIDALKQLSQQYILLGLPEHIGVEGNLGRGGTALAWNSFLNSFLNLQSNRYVNAENCAILGHIDFSSLIAQLENPLAGVYFRRQLTLKIDDLVYPIIQKIIEAGKIPIIIGGGHNNSFPNLKGASNALKQTIDCINLDAHTDLRQKEGRHSGNGFTFAKEENYLGKYLIYGLQQAYTPEYVFEEIDLQDDFSYTTYEEIVLDDENYIDEAFDFVGDKVALEVDTDVIGGFPSSAMNPVGFSIDEIQQFLSAVKDEKEVVYYHFCEAAPELAPNGERIVGKALSWWISQIISD